MTSDHKPRVLIFVVAYHAETTIVELLHRIPELADYETEVLIIDDCSSDATYALSEELRRLGNYRHRLTVLVNPVNQGYGGNQKIGYHYAIKNGFDIVALLHGDGQYAPEILPELLNPIARGAADVVLGSRMLVAKNALKGGMPLYKFVGNMLLTWYQNLVLKSSLSEFHTGYRAYAVDLLLRIPFDLNSNAFHFDTEIIIQCLRAQSRIVEIPIPTHYGEEICRVNGIRYARDVVNASTVAMLQDYGMVYRRNFDIESVSSDNKHYLRKVDFASTHSAALEEGPDGTKVLDVGCGPGHLSRPLRAKSCHVIGVDQYMPADTSRFDEFFRTDLNTNPFPRALGDVQVVLLLDILEHLNSPEKFCDELRRGTQANLSAKIVISTGNIGFFVTRFMLLLGQFNYNKRGILDLTHTRLFTFSSARRLLKETGFVVEKERGIPFPIPLFLERSFWQRALMKMQLFLIKISRGLFAYQIFMVARPLPTLQTLLTQAHRHTEKKAFAFPLELKKL
ncbi:MAG TPA: bifunctional glycosyltransferase/class I SAM-dependent methyltransferase [Candidatus Udaeobacter sp.]|jgi:glycosyltransferase involved in cell wall biosynthesis|nr:bifunctional glycosyltransferase/class I SAM-dependent methyltransferase [Candidatus Udaeobacter sp.]